MLTPPAPNSVHFTWSVQSDSDLRKIREELLRFFPDQVDGRTGDRTAQHMGLVATELAGNALRHGQPPVVVRLLSDTDCYILDVSDGAVHDLPRPAPARQSIGTGGRGLPICLAMAERVCWYATDTAKHVWASFPRPR